MKFATQQYPTPTATALTVVSPFWQGLWAVALAFTWLVPNHYLPWAAFHHDAWAAICMLLMAFMVFLRGPVTQVPWSISALICLFLACVPLLQYAAGQIVLAGTAWLATAYMLGLGLSLRVGQIWEHASPGTPAKVLFGAVVFAAIASTGLALYQWLGLDGLGIWGIDSIRVRPYAHLGQPNQLATLLCWGVIALMWLWSQGKLGISVWILASCFLLLGIALTASRTSWLILLLVAGLTSYWRALLPQVRLFRIGVGFAVFFVVCIQIIPLVSQAIVLPGDAGTSITTMQDRLSTELRPLVWSTFLDAVLRQPLWGFGWNQTSVALMSVLLEHPDLRAFFSHSHNLFLDLLIWMGIPLGGGISIYIVWRFTRILTAVRNANDAFLFILIMAVALHAMLELPLHYAYMLLPTGLAWGVLESRMPGWRWQLHARAAHLVLWGLAAVLTALMMRDYFNVQTSYQWLRYEWARIAPQGSAPVPRVLLLTQWREFVKFDHLVLKERPSPDDLRIMKNLADLSPSSGFLLRLAAAQAFSDSPEEAKASLRRACQINSEAQCRALRLAWDHEAKNYPAMQSIRW